MKKVAMINDLSGIGRCSLNVAIPIMATLQLQGCPLPTAILSNQTGFKSFSFLDFTTYMRDYFAHWHEIGYSFDGIYSGFLGSKEQIEILLEFIEQFKNEDTLVMIDPVMGDNGSLYSIYDEEFPLYMKQLVSHAEVITPNMTEFSLLTGYDLSIGLDRKAIHSCARALSEEGPKQIVITGIQDNDVPGTLINLGMDFRTGEFFEEKVTYNKVSYSGTGDIFASIICGHLVKGTSFSKAVKIASSFISKAIAYTEKQPIEPTEGIMYELFLKELSES